MEIFQVTKDFPPEEKYSLTDQIRRSSVSIPSNIAEGKERETVKELVRYLYISKGSAAELKTQLLIAHKVGYVNAQTYTYFSE
jgi:four helix bundle protein